MEGDAAVAQVLYSLVELQNASRDGICTCDPVTLKTIVRANPGVIVVQNGVVIDKYNIRNR